MLLSEEGQGRRTFVQGIIGVPGPPDEILATIGESREGSGTHGSRKRYCKPTMTDCNDSTGFQSSRRIFLKSQERDVRNDFLGNMNVDASLQADVSFEVEVGVVDLRRRINQNEPPTPARQGTHLLGTSDFWRLMRIV